MLFDLLRFVVRCRICASLDSAYFEFPDPPATRYSLLRRVGRHQGAQRRRSGNGSCRRRILVRCRIGASLDSAYLEDILTHLLTALLPHCLTAFFRRRNEVACPKNWLVTGESFEVMFGLDQQRLGSGIQLAPAKEGSGATPRFLQTGKG